MMVKTEDMILKELDGYKWREGQFVCVKCGNKKYGPGDEPYGRKCTNSGCKRNVSLIKYTAFEGMRFPIEKAYGMLETIVDTARLSRNEKVVPIRKRKKKTLNPEDMFDLNEFMDEEVEFISMLELIELAKARKWDPDRLNERLVKTTSNYRPSIGRLSKKFEIEENTVVKFLDKIANRITLKAMPELGSSLERVVEYISYNTEIKVLDVIGMAMVPLAGEWKYGEINIGEDLYGIGPLSKHSGPWSVFKRTPIKGTDGIHHIDEQEISYGSDEWYALFRELKDE
jgi:hypothetical protein